MKYKTIVFQREKIELVISLIKEGKNQEACTILENRLRCRDVLPEIEQMEIGDILSFPCDNHMQVRNKARILMDKYIDRDYVVNKKGDKLTIKRFK